jgi:hypothetical protein
MYKEDGVRFEEYTVKEIDKLQIRSEEDDIGAIVGEGSNCYVIEGNFLVFGKSASELEQIAWNAYSNIAKRPYRPYQSDEIGLPYLEVGDMKEYSTDTPIRSYMLHRTLTGIQALNDETGAEGSEECEQNFGVNKQITQLQGKQAIIKKTVEEVAVSVTNLDLALTGEMNVLAGQVVLKVMADGRIAAVDLTADPATGTAIVLKADNIKMEGLVTANSNFKILADGSIEVVNGKFSGVLTSPTVNGGNINGATIVSSDGTYTTTISNGSVTSTAIWAEALIVSNTIAIGANINLYASSGTVSATNVNCNKLNGYDPVTSQNIGNFDVHWADYAGTAQTAGTANYANDAGSAPLSYDWVNAIKMNVGALSSKTQTALPVPWPA